METRSDPWGGGSYPLMSEDSDWYAFPPSLSKRAVVAEMIHNFADGWLDDHVWYDDEGNCHGWRDAVRAMFRAVEQNHVRPAREDEYGYSDDWWYEDSAGPVEAWIVRL